MTVDKKPRALYLADVLAAGFECDQEWYEIESAKELRRLHAENEKLKSLCRRSLQALWEEDFPSLRDELRKALGDISD